MEIVVTAVTGVLAHNHVELDSKDEQDIVTKLTVWDQVMKDKVVQMNSAKVCLQLDCICTAIIIFRFIFHMYRSQLVGAFH